MICLTEFLSYMWRQFIEKESSRVLDKKNTFFFYSALKFLTYKRLFLLCLIYLAHFLLVLVCLCVFLWWFKSSYIFISSIFCLLFNWCDQQITCFKMIYILFLIFWSSLLSEHPASCQVCSLLLPPVAHLVLCWWSLDGLLMYSDICLSWAMAWHWQCFLVSSDEELAFWYLLFSLLWEWHLEEEVTLET